MPGSTRFGSQKRVALAGSERAPFAGGEDRSKAAGRIGVSVLVRRKEPLSPRTTAAATERMSRGEFQRRHGSDPLSVRLVKAFAQEYGLAVEIAGAPARRTLRVTGSVAALSKAFGVKLETVQQNGRTYRVREGAIQLPEELSEHVVAVLGLDNRPQAQAHFRIATPHANNVSYTPVQVAELYGFPTTSAKGQTVGLIELGGGFRAADLTAYFKSLGIPAPTVTAVSVDKGKNTPGDANGADGEVMLDIEVAGSVAAGAKIAVYFTPNTDQGFIDAVTTAVHDTANKPGVISISWGGPESTWTGQASAALDEACQAAAALGVTITVACGDNGSTDGVTGTASHVDFPASSPHVLACGGTKLIGSGTMIKSEVVWNETAANEGATGGGVSTLFALPTWQQGVGVPKASTSAGGRGVPDVSGDADPSTGYTIRVDGQTMVIGGTSAVAPLWAALITLANAVNATPAGFANPTLYAAQAKAFRDITEGNNGAYTAGPGWDACSGLGSPVGAAVVAVLGGAASSTGKSGKKKATAKKSVAKKTSAKNAAVKTR